MKRRIGLGVCAVATVAAASAVSVAHAGFSDGVCALLTARQVSTVGVVPLKCTAERPVKTRISTTYIGYWGSSPAAPRYLIIMVNKVTPAMIAVMKQKMQDKSGWVATPSRVAGVGSIAYEARKGDIGEIQFVAGPYFVGLTLHSPTLSRSPTRLTALAKVIAGKL